MKIKIGDYEKLIPKEYKDAISHMSPSHFEDLDRKRLTPLERFRCAEYAWRIKQSIAVQEYIQGSMIEQCVLQTNRSGESRWLALYSIVNGARPRAVVPRSVYLNCPMDLISYENYNF